MENRKKIIFIVDDNKSNLTVGSEALSGQYTVFTLDSGARMLKMLEKLVPDLILLDVEMPEMNGYEALEHIKRDSRFEQIPVIFLTALSSTETELRGLSLGAVDYIIKPFSPPLL
ncbi:MAG: response regulator, partial [Defluviitaleaceae bacterium]|nr:response regulator [Defluviitaleaceae bacterium]